MGIACTMEDATVVAMCLLEWFRSMYLVEPTAIVCRNCSDRAAQCSDRMYDFCFTFPYSLLLAFGGLIGFVTKGSVPSLLGGVGSASVLAACGYVSLQKYHQGRLCRPATVISLAVASGLMVMMWKRYQRTHNFVPAGLTAILSLAMVCFYVWNLLLFTPPIKQRSM